MPETTWGRIPKQGYVYLAMCGHTGLIKIGYTTDLKGRERTLKMSNPLIDFFDTHEATLQDEKALHLQFAERKVAGEWFNLEVNDYLAIEEYFKSRNNG